MTGGRGWPFWALVALLAVGHFTLHLALGLDRAAPDLLTLAVLLAARRASGGTAAGLGFALGLLQDSLSLDAFGAEALTLTVLGYLGVRSRDLLVGDSLVFLTIYLFVGKWLHDLIFHLLAGPGVENETAFRLLVLAPLAAVYAAAAGAGALALYRSATGER